MKNQAVFIAGILCLFVGYFFLGLAGASYKWRAFRNKQAWEGLTIPWLLLGLIFTAIGVSCVYLFYPFN